MMGDEVEKAVAKPRYVWWDMDSCEIPDGCEPCEIRWIIESALIQRYGPGPLTIVAIGNLRSVPPHVLEAMSRSGIIITHTPLGVLSMVTHLFTWVYEHWPSPAFLMLISDLESCYYESIVLFKSMGYTILRASLNTLPESPKYASDVWLWKSLLTQEETTRHEDELQGKCNETAWHCMLCCLDGQGFEDFTSHLKGGDHALKELLLLPHSSFIHEGEEHADEESLLLPHKHFVETHFLPRKDGKHAVKDPFKQGVRIACLEGRREKQLKAGTLPDKGGERALKESHMVSPDLAVGPSEKDASLNFKHNKREEATKRADKCIAEHLEAKFEAWKDRVKQEVSRDWAAGLSEKDASLDFLRKQLKAGTLPHALKESLLLPDKHFMETQLLPRQDGKHAIKKVQILWALRRFEKMQLKGETLPHKGGEHALKEVCQDCAAGPSEKDASLDFVNKQLKAGTLPHKGGEHALNDPVKQELRIARRELSRREMQLKALEHEGHMVSPDLAVGPSEEDASYNYKHKKRLKAEMPGD